jgi:predicted nucleotidyltransferase
LAKEAVVAKPHAGRIVEYLTELELITVVKLSKIWRIKANSQNVHFMNSKIVYNLNFIYHSGIIGSLNVQYRNPKSIVLFGSFRYGEDISTSDIDIAIESDDVKEYTLVKGNDFEDFENIIHRKIQLHLFNRKNVDINVFNNIANGVVLHGFLEVRK